MKRQEAVRRAFALMDEAKVMSLMPIEPAHRLVFFISEALVEASTVGAQAMLDEGVGELAYLGFMAAAAAKKIQNTVDAAKEEQGECFDCPKCGAHSHNPHDAANGYCGRCHAFAKVQA